MVSMNVAEAKAKWSEMIARAEAGETLIITRRGKTVARVGPPEAPRQPINFAAIKALRQSMPFDRVDSVAELRRAARY